MASVPASGSATILVIGSYVHDHVWLTDRFPAVGETRRALGFHTGPGGKGFNQAVACARQGADCVFMAAIGNDALGGVAQGFAANEGLACRWSLHADQPTAACGIIVDGQGANQIVVNLAANAHLQPEFLCAQADAFAAARLLLLQLEVNLDAVRAALQLAAEHALPCVLNPAPMHADVDAVVLAACELITPNETEFSQLLAQVCTVQVAANSIVDLPSPQLHALCRQLAPHTTVVITLGAAGCFVSHVEGEQRGDKEVCYRMAAEQATTIDTTGAGDAFNGALVAAMLRMHEAPFKAMVRHANQVAALSTETVGAATAMPSLAAVQARFGVT
ncbi:MAG: ribokinase [Dokdonella sp.]